VKALEMQNSAFQKKEAEAKSPNKEEAELSPRSPTIILQSTFSKFKSYMGGAGGEEN
jgi:hypothetical protein